MIAQLTGLAVISNFRVADMAAGGNGAPLVPFADFHLFSQEGRGVVVHNLGGIANCTWLPPEGSADGVIAFDTGPANMIMDALVGHYYPGEKFDRNGDHARAGRLIADLLDHARPPGRGCHLDRTTALGSGVGCGAAKTNAR